MDLDGQFDSSARAAFAEAYLGISPTPQSVELNFANVTHVGMAGVGLLQLLRDHLGGDQAEITIINTPRSVQQTLQAFNMDKLVTVL